MTTALREPIGAYFTAVNGDDVDSAVQYFADDASVLDEGRTMHGRTDIRQWIVETKAKYHHTIEPLKSTEQDGKVVVTSRLSGSFPGSPIEVRFTFLLQGGRISSLEIR